MKQLTQYTDDLVKYQIWKTLIIFQSLGLIPLKCPNDNYTDILGDALKNDGTGAITDTPVGALITDGNDASGNYIYYVFYDDGETEVVDEEGLNKLISINPNVRFKFQYR